MSGEVKLMPCPLRDAAYALLEQWKAYRDSDLSQMNAHDILVRYELWNALDAALWNTRPTVVTDEVVERVARAIDPDAWRIADDGGWQGLERARDYSIERARAALAAMAPEVTMSETDLPPEEIERRNVT